MAIQRKRNLISIRTPLGELPPDWRVYVEPYISRSQFSACWFWQGNYNHYSKAIMADLETGRGKSLRRFVMGMFYDYPNRLKIGSSCNNITCINPNHLYFMIQKNDPVPIKRPKKAPKPRTAPDPSWAKR